MASRALATTSFLLILNLLFFTLVTSTHTPKGCPPPPPPSCPPPPPPPPPCPPSPKPPTPSHPPPTPSVPPPKTPSYPPPTPSSPPKTPSYPPPTPSPSPSPTCPKDTLKLGVCADLLNDLLHLVVGSNPAKTPCCTLIGGLADLDAAVCLCTAIKANVLGIQLNVPVSLSLLLNYCGKKVPSGFQCT